jgi:hypothetical protein
VTAILGEASVERGIVVVSVIVAEVRRAEMQQAGVLASPE